MKRSPLKNLYRAILPYHKHTTTIAFSMLAMLFILWLGGVLFAGPSSGVSLTCTRDSPCKNVLYCPSGMNADAVYISCTRDQQHYCSELGVCEMEYLPANSEYSTPPSPYWVWLGEFFTTTVIAAFVANIAVALYGKATGAD